MKKVTIIAVALALFLTLGVFSAYYWFQNAIVQPNGDSASPVVFEVKSGDAIEVIAENLFKSGLLKEKEAFILYAKLNPDLVSKIQAGYFELTPTKSIKEIFVILQKAKNKEDIRVTIPEGLRLDEVAVIVQKAFATVADAKFVAADFTKFINLPDSTLPAGAASSFLKTYKPAGKNLEGFLYPDTYLFAKDATAADVIHKMVGTLELRLNRDDMTAISASKYSLYELLNVASIIERESLAVSEDALIADVLFKRMEQGINGVKLLQVDATLLYPAKDWKANVVKLKAVDNAYNTYIHPGLPPTPISSPGIAAIHAAIYPEDNDYFYYLHDNTGKIHFAKTYAEHLNNINKYL